MNRTELIQAVADEAEISKAAASRAVAAVINNVTQTLKRGRDLQLVGFGTFSVSKRAARTARNPRTGEAIKLAAMRVPKFKPGRLLKDAVR